ncbi:YeeE/YedE family protein [Rhodoferax sp. GW822-FHT02A01]|uniref:YeeE/YedE family protein n=1 Tax=Rhodoferax sp. GW822-FHT02A01 TaxID=3141537 RepID=UPI00315D11E2
MSRATLRNLAALASGVVFGLGLSLAQMTNPDKVLNFLDVAGSWDASLLFVLGGAVVVSAVVFHFILKRRAPLWDTVFHLPLARAIDKPLVIGSALFGIGWGLSGYCPGPAIASGGLNNPEALWVVPSIIAGAALQRWSHYRQTADID